MVTDIQQATIADMQEKIAETHGYLQLEEELARRHQTLMERRVDNAIKIGQNLCYFKATLPHGKFIPFVQTEFKISQPTAWRYMQIAEQETNHSTWNDLDVSPRAYAELASPSMPATVIEMVETKQIPSTVKAIQAAKREILAQEDEEEVHELSEEDRYIAAVDMGTTEYYYDGLALARERDRKEQERRNDVHVMRVMGSSESPEWYTPQDIVRLSIELLGEIELDPCSNSHESPNVPARSHYTKEDDGLAQTWEGKVYLNPPYGSEIPRWVEKLVNSYGHGVTEAIALLPGRIDTLWFSPLYAFPMCNVRGRIQYENSPYHAPFPCVIVYLGDRLDDFIRVFGNMGPIMKKVGGR